MPWLDDAALTLRQGISRKSFNELHFSHIAKHLPTLHIEFANPRASFGLQRYLQPFTPQRAMQPCSPRVALRSAASSVVVRILRNSSPSHASLLHTLAQRPGSAAAAPAPACLHWRNSTSSPAGPTSSPSTSRSSSSPSPTPSTRRYASSGRRWTERQKGDQFARAAKVQGLKSRAAFKLLQINERYRLFKPGMTVVDLGFAPGSWSQVSSKTPQSSCAVCVEGGGADLEQRRVKKGW